MLEKLQKKWKVGPLRLLLILVCFAAGGSLCGYIGRKILGMMHIENAAIWGIAYVIVVTLLWPACVMLTSLPLGQFVFFKNYISNLINRIASRKIMEKQIHIAVFASGKGTNAANLVNYFNKNEALNIKVALIVCNKPEAGVLDVAARNELSVLMLDKEIFFRGDAYVKTLKQANITYLVLAGFLWKVPGKLISAYSGQILNVHPALLPKFGGKGMYGQYVHEAVIAQKETESGITIHEVDEVYDIGKVIFQAKCEVAPGDDAATLAEKIHQLEQENFPTVVEEWIREKENTGQEAF